MAEMEPIFSDTPPNVALSTTCTNCKSDFFLIHHQMLHLVPHVLTANQNFLGYTTTYKPSWCLAPTPCPPPDLDNNNKDETML